MLDSPSIVSDLEQLASAPPRPIALDASEVDDTAAWLEAYAAGVGSPLELAFLRLIEGAGIRVSKQLPIAPSEGETPITTADFAVESAKVAIYVDGAAFHTGDRRRRDRFIRERLVRGASGWRVVVWTAKDLGTSGETVGRLRALLV